MLYLNVEPFILSGGDGIAEFFSGYEWEPDSRPGDCQLIQISRDHSRVHFALYNKHLFDASLLGAGKNRRVDASRSVRAPGRDAA